MATFNYFNDFTRSVAEKEHNLSTGTMKIALTNTAPSATQTKLSNITQIAAANNYAAGGFTITTSGTTNSGGTYKLILTDKIFTASGGAVGPFRYFVLYNSSSTTTTNALVGYWDYGSALTLADGETVTIDFSATSGVLTLAHA
jgi:hypothetical protein